MYLFTRDNLTNLHPDWPQESGTVAAKLQYFHKVRPPSMDGVLDCKDCRYLTFTHQIKGWLSMSTISISAAFFFTEGPAALNS
jgi:hypothetical protein